MWLEKLDVQFPIECGKRYDNSAFLQIAYYVGRATECDTFEEPSGLAAYDNRVITCFVNLILKEFHGGCFVRRVLRLALV